MSTLKVALAQIAPAGHYSRPDVTKLSVNRERQSIIDLINE